MAERLEVNGRDLRPLPLSERRQRREALLPQASPDLVLSEAVEDPRSLLAILESWG